MKTRMYAIAATIMASGLAVIWTKIAAKSAIGAGADSKLTTARSSVGEPTLGGPAEPGVSEAPAVYDEIIVKWIPMVPLFAVVLAVGAYFILGMSL